MDREHFHPGRFAFKLPGTPRRSAMRAVWYDRQGPANEVIVTGELPTPNPGTGQVLVRLEASGVNPSEPIAVAARSRPSIQG
jgi:NADPH:quinone reductase-like Zn-dependent oxidoreductase